MSIQNLSARLIIAAFCIASLTGCGGDKKGTVDQAENKGSVIIPDKKIELWNGKDFTGWNLFVPEVGIDVKTVWMVKDGILHCTGVPYGYIRTKKDYKNYLLTVEWRWPAEPGNSGVLLHMSGPDKVWPKCIEAQLMSDNAGDFWMMDGTTINEQTDKSERRVEKMAESSEKTPGEWNTYKIVCKEDRIDLKINGIHQNSGTLASVRSGKICFQSEGKPIEFRAIYLEPLD